MATKPPSPLAGSAPPCFPAGTVPPLPTAHIGKDTPTRRQDPARGAHRTAMNGSAPPPRLHGSGGQAVVQAGVPSQFLEDALDESLLSGPRFAQGRFAARPAAPPLQFVPVDGLAAVPRQERAEQVL